MSRRRRLAGSRLPNTAGAQALQESSYDVLLSGSGIDSDEHLYRRLTGARGDNLPAYQHDKMLGIAKYLYRTNPVAHRFVTILADFILGEGVSLTFQNADVQAVVERHWNDQYNDWERYGADRLTTYLVSGEFLMPLFPNTVDGHLRVGSVLPDNINDVITDIENWAVVEKVELKRRSGDQEPIRYAIVNVRDGYETLQTAGKPALFWKRDNPFGSRGMSILYTVADFLDLLDQMAFNEVERALLLKAFIWTVTIEDADVAKLQELAKLPQYAEAPKPASVKLQNSKVKWEAVTPRLESFDAANLMRFLRNHIFGAGGIPVHFFAEGEDVNKASAEAMAEPARKRFTSLQDEWRFILSDVIGCQIDYAVLAGALPALVPVQDSMGANTSETVAAREAFSLGMSDLSPADTQDVVTALETLTKTLMIADDEGYITEDTARKIFLLQAQQVGHDFDVEEESERAAAEQEARRDAVLNAPQALQPPVQLQALAGGKQQTGTDD